MESSDKEILFQKFWTCPDGYLFGVASFSTQSSYDFPKFTPKCYRAEILFSASWVEAISDCNFKQNGRLLVIDYDIDLDKYIQFIKRLLSQYQQMDISTLAFWVDASTKFPPSVSKFNSTYVINQFSCSYYENGVVRLSSDLSSCDSHRAFLCETNALFRRLRSSGRQNFHFSHNLNSSMFGTANITRNSEFAMPTETNLAWLWFSVIGLMSLAGLLLLWHQSRVRKVAVQQVTASEHNVTSNNNNRSSSNINSQAASSRQPSQSRHSSQRLQSSSRSALAAPRRSARVAELDTDALAETEGEGEGDERRSEQRQTMGLSMLLSGASAEVLKNAAVVQSSKSDEGSKPTGALLQPKRTADIAEDNTEVLQIPVVANFDFDDREIRHSESVESTSLVAQSIDTRRLTLLPKFLQPVTANHANDSDFESWRSVESWDDFFSIASSDSGMH